MGVRGGLSTAGRQGISRRSAAKGLAFISSAKGPGGSPSRVANNLTIKSRGSKAKDAHRMILFGAKLIEECHKRFMRGDPDVIFGAASLVYSAQRTLTTGYIP